MLGSEEHVMVAGGWDVRGVSLDSGELTVLGRTPGNFFTLFLHREWISLFTYFSSKVSGKLQLDQNIAGVEERVMFL